MVKGPAVVVVARHGARLDASDKSWHLTSPTPYDPPLTYGGWAQGKALGLRIAALLHERDLEQAQAAKNDPNHDLAHLEFSKLDAPRSSKLQQLPDASQRPKKKRKIVIHSSPFQRCIQTSTAVAAGISQWKAPGLPNLRLPPAAKERTGSLGPYPYERSPYTKSPNTHPTTLDPLADPNLEVFPKPLQDHKKILLRIDAFLGEWLSPDYFEDITPPPNSTLMVASAKADLLRRGDYIQEQNKDSSKGHFPGGWNKLGITASESPAIEAGAFPNMRSLSEVSPFRERSTSHASPLDVEKPKPLENKTSLTPKVTRPPPRRPYEHPVPSYSVSPADPIPRGYVAHARDACIQVDFQWDSMRDPQCWGDGGEYGDEWSTMHKRFRRGLAGMMEWYREHGTAPPQNEVPGFMFKVLSNNPPPPPANHASELYPTFNNEASAEYDEELIVVLITHGAGCNALLGAITNQPVLIDVGLASLSMAVRRAQPRKPSTSTIYERRASVADAGMTEHFEMKYLASVDHLRPGVDPSRPPHSQSQASSPAVLPSPSLEYRRRFTGSSAANSPLDSPFTLGEPYRNWNSSLGSMRRTMSSGSRYSQQHATSSTASPSTGLWSSPRPQLADGSSDSRSSPSVDTVASLQSTVSKPVATAPATNSNPAVDGGNDGGSKLIRLDSKEERETSDSITPLLKDRGRTASSNTSGLWGAPKSQPKPAHGLWGPPKLDDVYEHGRGPKRRWTVTERGDGS